MKDCRPARAAILEVVRGSASEATRLLLDEHLASCARCREERAQWSLLEHLREDPAPTLGPEARARVVRQLLARGQAAPRTVPSFWAGRKVLAIAAAAVLLVGGVWLSQRKGGAGSQGSASLAAGDGLAPTTLFHGDGPGELTALSGVTIAYEAGTTLRVPRSAAGRIVELVSGRVDVDVTPSPDHGAARFEVRTATFVVEVLGTRFIVTPDEVRTLRGIVRVRDTAGRVLAVLKAGQVWERQPAALPPQESPLSPVVDAPGFAGQVAASPTAAPRALTAKSHGKSAAALLSEARALLGAGESKRARDLLAEVGRHGGRPRQKAMAQLLTGDSYLIEGRRDLALPLYRATARAHAGTAEGETAAFAAAEIQVEQGARNEARRALREYLAQYPTGHFAHEAQERLAALGTP